MTTKKKQYYALTYYRPERELRARAFTSQLHKTRDGLAPAELSAALQQGGYTYGGAFLNVPETTQHEEADAVRDSAFTPSTDDLIVVATRPPLDDEDTLSRRTIARSHHPVEELLLQELRTVFRIYRRNAVVLHEPTNVDRRYRSVQVARNHWCLPIPCVQALRHFLLIFCAASRSSSLWWNFLIPSFVPYPLLSFRAEELDARVVADAVL